MNANPYLYVFLVLAVLACVGFTLAMHQDMKPSNVATNHRWTKWMFVMGVLAMADTVMIKILS